MEMAIGIIGLVITLLSFGFGLIQWRDNLKSKEIYNQNIRKLWDMSRSYSPFRTTTDKHRIIEYVDHLHEHFYDPVVIKNGAYMPPILPGYSITMKEESLKNYSFPNGNVWKEKTLRKDN